MFKVNEYFGGKVTSIGFESAGGPATAGVIAPGEYEFNTGKPEIMRVSEGKFEVMLAGEAEWKTYTTGQEFLVPGNSSFKIKTEGFSSYICLYQ